MNKRLLTWLLCALAAATLSAQEQLTNLPTLYIDTYSGAGITSKDVYQYASFVMVNGADTMRLDSTRIRGRGNSSWNNMGSKRPYRLKLAKKERLLGKDHANSKNWVLLAQADDKSFIRNALTWSTTEWMQMPYSPAYTYVDLYLNGNYRGNYMLCDHIDIRKKRIDTYEQEEAVADTDTVDISGGYLLEADGFTEADNTYFQTDNAVNIRVHSPDEDVISARQISYIRSVVQQFEDAIYDTDHPASYKSFVDLPSFLRWYIAGEITANIDAYWSVYFFKKRYDPLLYWGPLWDEDLSYNNTTRLGDVTEALMADVGHGRRVAGKWIDQLLGNTTDFWADVALLYDTIYNAGLTDYMLQTADSLATLLRPSAERNFEIWDIEKKVYEEIYLFSTFDEYVDAVKQFVSAHNDYLLEEFHKRAGQAQPDEEEGLDPSRYYRLHILGDTTFVLGLEQADSDAPPTTCLRSSDPSSEAQQWRPFKSGEGYRFVNRESGLALADYNLSTPYSYALVTYPVDSLDERQIWLLTEGKQAETYNLINASTSRVIDNRHGVYSDGNEVISYKTSSSDTSAPNRLWIFEPMGAVETESLTAIRSALAANYCLRFSPEAARLRFIAEDRSVLTFSVDVYAVSGQHVRSFRADEGCSLADLPSGTYIARWSFAGRNHSAKFIKS